MKIYKSHLVATLVFVLIFSTSAQTRKISISVNNSPIKEIFAQIQQKSGYRILFNDEVVPDNLKVSVNAENVSVKDILQKIFTNTDLRYIAQSENLIIITSKKFTEGKNEIFGTVTDENNEAVSYANVALFQLDDTTKLSYGAVTDDKGCYKLANVKSGNYRLKISFIGYKNEYSNFDISDNEQTIVRNFQLVKDVKVLNELTVVGEKPALKAENGKLIYYIPTLLKNKPVTNTYDALKEIPGIIEQKGQLMLIGTNGMTILLNGKKTTMTDEQWMNFLKSVPVSRLENIEIMYSTPPKYNVRGAAVNIILKKNAEKEMENVWLGEIAAEYKQKVYANANGRVNLLSQTKNTTLDALYSGDFTDTYTYEQVYADHLLNNKTYHIEQKELGASKNFEHNVRLAVEHKLDNKDELDISYTGIFEKKKPTRNSNADMAGNEIYSYSTLSGTSTLHNLKIDYTAHGGLNLGAEYTYYKDTTNYAFQNTSDSNNDHIQSKYLQKINKFFVYANQTHAFKNNWELDYGVNLYKTYAKNSSNSHLNNAVYTDATFDNAQNEIIWNAFAGFSKTFSQQLSLQASISAEHYKATEQSKGIKNTIWNDVAYFPNLNISYIPSANHIFQFSLTSDKTYPSYWSLNPSVFQFGAYGMYYGNPQLRPMRNYEIGLTYIYKNKYVIRPFFSYISDYYMQLPYQSPEKLQQEFVEQNFDFRKQMGVIAVIPFNITKYISSKITTQGIYWQEKDDTFFDIPFNRRVFFGYISLNSDIDISSKPDLKMNLTVYYTSPAIQGIFNLSHTSNLLSGITWTFDKQRAKLIFKANDLFKTSLPVAVIDYKGQKSTLKSYQDARFLSLSFVYRFGGFKEKEKKKVDTSRFGTN